MSKYAAFLPIMFLIINTQPAAMPAHAALLTVPQAIKPAQCAVMTASPTLTIAVNKAQPRTGGVDLSLMALENELRSCDR